MNFKKFGIIVLLALFILTVPACFAHDNQTDSIASDSQDTLSTNASYFSPDNQNIDEPLLDDDFINPSISYTERNTFYVDSSYDGDEVGSASNPFKTIDKAFSSLTFNRSVINIHIASGEYKISKTISITKNMNIIGENPLNTIIDGLNMSEIFLVGKNGLSVNFINLTFSNGNTYYGGAIYNNRSSVKLVNTIFKDNYAVGYQSILQNYSAAGGALYNDAGIFKIYNSSFINNKAISSMNVYGAAIYNELGTLSILNSRFINNYIGDGDYGSGGVIYNFNGFLTAYNSTFNNNVIDSNYSIGGVVYNYEAHNVYLIACEFDGNRIYGNYTFGSVVASSAVLLEIVNSTISNNHADGIGFENSTICNINGIYNLINSNMTNNTIKEPKKSLLLCLEDQFIVSNAFTDNMELPSKYDLRNYNLVTYAKSQGSSGACWAFATISSLESYLLKYENVTYDISENNLKNLMNYRAENGTDWVDGGNYQMALAYFLRWDGPVSEDDDYYSAYSVIPNYDVDVTKHVQGAIFLPLRLGYLDNYQIKRAIMEYGALYVSINGESIPKNVYHSLSEIPNHAVAIVGWDDDYSASKFIGEKPPGNGAFIIKNSWGSSYGEKGFGYVSYYDKTFAGFSLDSLSAMAFTSVEDITNYKDIYQYDILGNTYESIGYGNNTAWLANQFTATSDNPLSAIGLYTYGASDYLADIYVNGDLKYTQKGSLSHAGYHTIKLDNLINLSKDDIFRINVKLTTFDSLFPIAIESSRSGYSSKAQASQNQSFISPDGVNWFDIADDFEIVKIASLFYNKTLSQTNVCLKAYTANVGDLHLEIASSSPYYLMGQDVVLTFNLTNFGDYVKNINVTVALDSAVTVSAINSTKGEFNDNIWSINELFTGKSAILNITGICSENSDVLKNTVFIHTSDNAKNNDEIVEFDLPYVSSTKFVAELNVSVFKSGETLKIRLMDALSKPVANRNVVVNLNGLNNTQKTDENGFININLNLAEGNHTYELYFEGDESYNPSMNAFDVSIIKTDTSITASNFQTYVVIKSDGNIGQYLKVTLKDANLNLLKDKKIKVILNSKTYEAITNSQGVASIQVNIDKVGTYSCNIDFKGDEKCYASSKAIKVTINKKKTSLKVPKRTYKSTKKVKKLTTTLKDNKNKAVSSKKVYFKVNGKIYTAKTNKKGVASVKIKITKKKTYSVSVSFKGDSIYNKVTKKSKLIVR